MPYFASSVSSSSEYTPGATVTVVRTMPSASARLSSRDTLACEMLRAAAMSACRTPRSWYMRATLVSRRT